MPVKIKSQKDVLATEVSVDLPADLNEIDQLMRLSKATGTVIATYNQGGMLGVNIKQNKRIPEKVSDEVREIVGVGSRKVN